MEPEKITAETKVKNFLTIKKSHLIWGIILYGIIMWAAGFIWAGVVL